MSETLPRESIYLAQTPQAFTRRVLREALALGEGGPEATDEAALAERAGHPVRLVEGEATNIKITTPDDLAAIARRLRGQQHRGLRAPAVQGPATTSIVWCPDGRSCSAASRSRPRSARSVTPTRTSSATR